MGVLETLTLGKAKKKSAAGGRSRNAAAMPGWLDSNYTPKPRVNLERNGEGNKGRRYSPFHVKKVPVLGCQQPVA